MKEFFKRMFNFTYGSDPVRELTLDSITESIVEDTTEYHLTLSFKRDEEVINDNIEINYYVPTEDNSLVRVNEKSRVQITSARYNPSLRFYGSSAIKVGESLYIKLSDNTVSFNYSEHVITCEEFFNYFGLLSRYNPELTTSEVRTLNADDLLYLNAVEIPSTVNSKIEILSAGKYKFKSNKVTSEFLSYLLDVITNDEVDYYNTEIPTDYTYITAIDGLVYELFDNWKNIKDESIFRLNTASTIYPTQIQNIIDRYFRMQAQNFRDIQVAKNSNAVTMLSQSKRLYFYKGSRSEGWTKSAVFNNYFRGVLDPVKTLENNNVNISNELTLNTRISDGKLLIKVYDTKFKEIEITYDEYTTSPVLQFNFIDWTTKKVKTLDKYGYYQYGKSYDTTDLSIIKYYGSPENSLSPATACIPFINRMVATRSLLSAHFLDQGIPVVGAKPPAVSTSANKRYYKESPYNTKSSSGGKVVGVLGSMVKVENDDGTIKVYGSENNHEETSEHSSNIFEPTVKVGDKVKKDQVLIKMNSFVDGEFAIQVPLYVAYDTYFGGEKEDGIILTESAAKKFAHISYLEEQRSLLSNYEYEFTENTKNDKYDKYGLIKVGSPVERGEVLFQYTEISDDTVYGKIKAPVTGSSRVASKKQIRAPYEVMQGTVTKATIYVSKEETDFEKYYSDRNKKYIQEIESFTGRGTYQYVIDTPEVSFVVFIEIRYLNTMELTRLSGKLSNLYASKGVNTKIISDEEAPVDEFGNKIECIIQSTNYYSRQNPNQVDEAKLGLVCLEGLKWIKKHHSSDPDKVKKFLELLYPNSQPKVSELIKDGDKYGYLRVTVEPFDEYYTRKTILPMLDMLGLGNGDSKIFKPKINKWTTYKCTVGLTAMMRLHFMQDKKAKVTSGTNFDSPDDVLSYSSVDRAEGQKIGGQEIWAHLANGTQTTLSKLVSEDKTKEANLASTMLLLGMKIV
jgi:DNA-directed RNA polymerase beta subunit